MKEYFPTSILISKYTSSETKTNGRDNYGNIIKNSLQIRLFFIYYLSQNKPALGAEHNIFNLCLRLMSL